MKKLLQFKLKVLAKIILRKYRPKIVGISGSVGKTSAKEAIYAVLRQKYRARKSIKNYNNELGLPLTVIGESARGRSLVGWLAVFLRALALIVKKDPEYPEILILEMGIDRPGDMDYLLGIARPDIGVLTSIGTVHAKYFGSRGNLAKEKIKLVEAVRQEGFVLVNRDNEYARRAIDKSRAKVISYGLEPGADLRALELRYSFETDSLANTLSGLNFKLAHKGRAVPVYVPNVLSEAMVYAALAGAAVGLALDINLLEISQALRDLTPPKGRMNPLPGIKGCFLIDDSYNSEPQSLRSAISMLARIPSPAGGTKYAVLGDMLELGKYSVEKHQEIGRLVAEKKINKLAIVGERARDIKRAALEAGMDENDTYEFSDSLGAGKFLQNRINPGDIILIKGSQGMRMEKIAKELMADPLNAAELLVRQDSSWL